MAVTSYQGWLADHQRAIAAHPTADLARTLHGHGYNVGRLDIVGLGDERHLTASTPEDHTPYSHTPWPGSQPYPYVLAVDIMEPVPAGMPSLVKLAEKLLADRNAGRPEIAWLKYMNRPLGNGNSLHESWKPGHTTTSTTDKGHIHLSCRTDYAISNAAQSYDPVAELLKPSSTGDLDMKLIRWTGSGAVFVTNGPEAKWVTTPQEVADWQAVTGAGITVVGTQATIGRIKGPRPPEFADSKFGDGEIVTLTDAQLADLAKAVDAIVPSAQDIATATVNEEAKRLAT